MISGACGALGRHLTTALKNQGQSPISISRSASQHERAHAVADLLQPCALDFQARKASHFIHAAWITKHPDYWDAPENIRWADASIELFEQFAAAGGQHFTFIGSCAEFGWAGADGARTDNLGKPRTLYGQSKRRVTDTLRKRADELGIGFTAARLFFPYGAGENENRVTTLVIDSLLGGKPFHLRQGDVYRDIYSTRSAAAHIVELTMSGLSGVFDITSGQKTHLGRFLKDHLAAALGAQDLISWDPYDEATQKPEENPQVLVGLEPAPPTHSRCVVVDDAAIKGLIDARRKKR